MSSPHSTSPAAAEEAAYRLALMSLRSFSLANVRFSLSGTHMTADVRRDGRRVGSLFCVRGAFDCAVDRDVLGALMAEARIFARPDATPREVFAFYADAIIFAALLDANLTHTLVHDDLALSRREVAEVDGDDTLQTKAARLLASGSRLVEANPHWWDRREGRFVPAAVLAESSATT